MKKINFAIAAIMSLSMLTACSGNTNSAEVSETSAEVTTTSQTETGVITTEEVTTMEETTTSEETTSEKSETTMSSITETSSVAENIEYDPVIKKYADGIYNIINSPDYEISPMTPLFLLMDINADGVLEIVRLSFGITASGVTIYDTEGNCLYHNFGAEFSLITVVDTETNEKDVLFKGENRYGLEVETVVEALNGQYTLKSTKDLNDSDATIVDVEVVEHNNDTNTVVESGTTEDEYNDLYTKYFGKYTIIDVVTTDVQNETEQDFRDVALQFAECKDGIDFSGFIKVNYDSIYNGVENYLLNKGE